MNILIVTPHFYPENFKVNDIAFNLASKGHEVTVLTAIPDYPEGKFHKGYGLLRKRKEKINGVTIIRTIIIPRHDGSAKWLVLNYLSYTLFSILRSIHIGVTKRFDKIIVHETSPIMVGIPAIIVKKLQKAPLYFWVLDLWPESLEAAGGIKNKTVISIFKQLSKWIYKNCDIILVSSKGFTKSINQFGDYSSKIHYFPNWNDVDAPKESTNTPIPDFPKGFNIVFTGNIGDAQDMPSLIECAKKLRGTNINFILIGDGRRKKYIEECVDKFALTNIFLFGRYPLETMSSFYQKADILFLSLKDKYIFSLTVPAKLQTYMNAGKPIVGMINGEGANLINEANCGWTVKSGDYESLSDLIIELQKTDQSILTQKGINGKTFCDLNFRKTTCLENLNRLISQVL